MWLSIPIHPFLQFLSLFLFYTIILKNVRKCTKTLRRDPNLISFKINCYIAFDMCECVFLRKTPFVNRIKSKKRIDFAVVRECGSIKIFSVYSSTLRDIWWGSLMFWDMTCLASQISLLFINTIFVYKFHGRRTLV